MKARLTAISGLGGKGPACFLVESGERRLMLDLGYGPRPGLWPDVDRVGTIDALLLSHGHADHAGGLALLPKIGNPPVYATEVVARALPAGTVAATLPLKGAAEVLGVRVETGRSGHAPGGVWIRLDVGAGLLYMGDCSVESALYAYDPPPAAGTLIVDASYGEYDTPLAGCQERLAPVFDGPPALLPVPENGRGPEIALHLSRSGRPAPHLDDAMRSALRRLAGPDSGSLREGIARGLAQLAAAAPPIDGPRGVMLASRADAAGGEVARLVARWEAAPAPAIVFTGYLPPGTPAERLAKSGRARQLRWNVHPRFSDNIALARSVAARAIVPAFGAVDAAAWERALGHARMVRTPAVDL